jgi:hypothetical protein
MDNLAITRCVAENLTLEQIPFMLVGSFSSNLYGVPRSTQDADFVVDLRGKSIKSLASRLPTRFRIDPQMRFEVATQTKCYTIEIDGTAFTIELFQLTADEHDQERFRRRIAVDLAGCRLHFPTAEDVIIQKLRWYQAISRSKDYADILDVISVQRDQLDWAYICRWCDVHGTRTIIDRIRETTSEP